MNFSGRPATTSTMSGKSTRSALSTSISRGLQGAKAFRQALMREDLPVPPPVSSTLLALRPATNCAVLRCIFLLRVDLFQVVQRHATHVAHRLQRAMAAAARTVAPGNGSGPVGRRQRLG